MKKQSVGVNEIARRLGIRKATIIGWLAKSAYEEGRGWKSGRRVYSSKTESRVVTLKKDMIERKDYFLGAPYVQMHYAKEYPDDPLPSEWFINDGTRHHKLQTHEPKKRSKGQDIVSRLRFPIKSIVTLGRIHQAADFIGKKFIVGRTEPISIFSTSYYQWLKMYQVRRVLAETAEGAMDSLREFWVKFPIPDVLRVDNGMTFRGTGAGSGHIGRFVKFILNVGITPLFSAAYQSYTNPHIEGHNSTFTQKLWSKHLFGTMEDIDHECTRFNEESERFYRWKFKERLAQKSLSYLSSERIVSNEILRSTKGKKVCFIRFVQRWKETEDRYGVVVLNRFIVLKPEYNNQYVFVELNLETATIHVYSEHDGIRSQILKYPFPFTL